VTEVKLVRDLMKVGVATCPIHTPLVEIARLLLNADLEGVVVMDQEGHAVGVVTQDELVRACVHEDYQRLTAETVMREEIPQVPPDIPLTAALQIMQDLGVRVVYLMHHAEGIHYPAAALSYRHILRYLAAEHESELGDLGIRAKRETPIETFMKRRDAARRKARSPQEE